MTIHKINSIDFDYEDFLIIAIHSILEDYRLAYQLNKNLNILFEKSNQPISYQTKNEMVNFSKYIFELSENESLWELIQNQTQIEIRSTGLNLFETESFSKNVTFIEELKKVDYILKIESNNLLSENKIIKKNY